MDGDGVRRRSWWVDGLDEGGGGLRAWLEWHHRGGRPTRASGARRWQRTGHGHGDGGTAREVPMDYRVDFFHQKIAKKSKEEEEEPYLIVKCML